MTLSSRHAPALCLALAIALVPTIIHTYSGRVADDGRSAAGMPATIAGERFVSTGRAPDWGQRLFDSGDWFETRSTGPGPEVTLTVLRSYDLKKLYHHPELTIAYGTAFLREEIARAEARPEVPLHVLRAENGASTAVAVLHYGDEFVENPIWLQVRVAGQLLVSPRKPITLFFARQRGEADRPVDDLKATRIVFAAVDEFLSQALPADR